MGGALFVHFLPSQRKTPIPSCSPWAVSVEGFGLPPSCDLQSARSSWLMNIPPQTVEDFPLSPFLTQSLMQGTGAKLKSHIEYVWCSCSGDIAQQSDLFRLTYTHESLKALGWRNELVTPAE